MRWYKSSRWFCCLLLVTLGIFTVMPLVWVFAGSFQSPISYMTQNLLLAIQKRISILQYRSLLFWDLEYWAAYWNTILLTVTTMLLALLLASLAAYGLMLHKGRLLWIYALLSLLPAQTLLVPHLLVINNLSLVGSRWAVILIGCCCPWYVFFLYRVCRQIPEEILEAARVEGAGELCIFYQIALPQMRPGLLIFSVIISADLWSMVEEPLIYIQDTAKYPLSVLFHEMGEQISYAGIVIFTLPVIVLFFSGIRKAMKEVIL